MKMATLLTMSDLKPEQIIALLVPIVLLQLGLMIAALFDLEHEDRHVRGGNKLVWILVIVFVNVIGPIVYFVAGREEA
jgi:Phospholipase_D-nuclease N-terminal